ncbi:MAG: methionyl-tRNA formyltransferase [Oligoflexia bacterium]|nr:methionyl-tRNA formyltransferase [Oligoflexia bacterium]
MKIIFCGSPIFAADVLQCILNSKHKVQAVITQPDRPSGRGLKVTAPAVKVLAEAHKIEVYQPEKINTEETIHFLKKIEHEILVVVAYGEFLGKAILDFHKYPPINVHPSLLPKYRGAAPAQWAVINGEIETGISVQFMSKKMDAGDIILQKKFSIGPDETAGELLERLTPFCGETLIEALDLIENNTFTAKPQNENNVSFAPLLSKETGQINWEKQEAIVIHNLVRGTSPWPGGYTFYKQKRVKIIKTKLSTIRKNLAPGTLYVDDGHYYISAASETLLEIISLQPEGKKALLPSEFANGIGGGASSPIIFSSGGQTDES